MAKCVLPNLGEGVKSAVVSYWHIELGEVIAEGADLVEMSTDKATFNVPASVGGTLKAKYFEEGDTVQVGQTLAEIE